MMPALLALLLLACPDSPHDSGLFDDDDTGALSERAPDLSGHGKGGAPVLPCRNYPATGTFSSVLWAPGLGASSWHDQGIPPWCSAKCSESWLAPEESGIRVSWPAPPPVGVSVREGSCYFETVYGGRTVYLTTYQPAL